MAKLITDLLAAVLALLVLDTVTAANRLAPRLVKRAASKMPTDELKDRYEAEWLAELDSVSDYKLVVLIRALGIWFTSHDAIASVSGRGTMTLAHLVKAGFSSTAESWAQERISPNFTLQTAPGFIYWAASMRLAKHLADGNKYVTSHHSTTNTQIVQVAFPSGVGLGYRIFGRAALKMSHVALSGAIIIRLMPPRRWLPMIWGARTLTSHKKVSFKVK